MPQFAIDVDEDDASLAVTRVRGVIEQFGRLLQVWPDIVTEVHLIRDEMESVTVSQTER